MKMLSVVKASFWGNSVALFIFSYLLVYSSMFTDLDVRMKFTALDRAGVINEEALGAFDTSFGFAQGYIRNSVPRFIAGPALEKERRNALAGVCLAFINAFVAGAVWLHVRKTRPGSEAQPPSMESS